MAVAYSIGAPLGTGTIIADQRTLPGGTRVTIKNTHATETVYLGGDENQDADEDATDLGTANGFPLAAGATVTIDIGAGDVIYARGALTTTTTTVAVFRTSPKGT